MAIDRNEKFKKLAEGRLKRTSHDIKLIGNLSDKSNYRYTDDDVTELFKQLDDAVLACKERFVASQS